MPILLYIHGFLSSPLSHKAQQLKDYCSTHRPDYQFFCPQLNPYPEQSAQQLLQIVKSASEPVYVVGSSMGGFWATWLAEQHGCKAVLINPATEPSKLMPQFLGVPLKNYHNDETYILTEQHLEELKHYETDTINQQENIWVLLQTDDETLDYRLAEKKYIGCKQTIEKGGDHSFQKVERFFPEIFTFFTSKNM